MSVKTKVLILLPSFAGGGAERTIANLLSVRHSSLEIKVFLLDQSGPYLYQVKEEYILSPSIKSSFSVDRISNPFYATVKMFTHILPSQKQAIKTFEPDVVMTVTESMNYLGYFWKIVGLGRNYKWIIRSGNNIFAEAESKGKIIGFVFKTLLRLAYRKADRVITISEAIKKEIVQKLNLPESKVETIYNPLDLERIKSLSSENLQKPWPFVLGVGRLARQKKFDLLIDAYAKSKIWQDGIHLIILGQGGEKQNLLSLAEKHNLSNFIHLVGFKQNPYAYMKQAEAFVLSSSWEGFAHVVAEALAVGCPVISTDCPFGPSEILQAGKYGRLISTEKPNEMAVALTEIIRMPSKEKQMAAEQGITRVEKFGINEITNQYFSYFKKISSQ